MEWASFRTLIGRWDAAFNRSELSGRLRMGESWDGLEQSLGVGVLWAREYVPYVSLFHHLAKVHDDDTSGHLCDDPQIMGYEQHRHTDLGLKFQNELQYLRLGGYVQSSCGFVGYQKARIGGQGYRNHHSLAHSTAESEGVLIYVFFDPRNAHPPQEVHGHLSGLCSGNVLMKQDRFHYVGSHAVDGAQRSHGFLEYHGDLPATDGVYLRSIRRKLAQIHCLLRGGISCTVRDLAVKEDLTPNDPSRRAHQSQDRPRRHTLTTSALPYQTHYGAAWYIEANVIHRAH